MAISKNKKTEILEKLKENFKNSKSVAFTSNNGLTVEEVSELRKDLREVDAKFMLAKKTLIKIAMKEVYDVEMADDNLEWQIAVLFSFGDEVAGLWKVDKFIKKVWEGKVKWSSSYMDGKINWAEETKALAKLPSKDTLLWMLVGTMQAPVQKFVGTLDSVISSFARVLNSAKCELEEKWKEKVWDLVK